MGHRMSISLNDWINPLESPRNDRPPTFDPLAGFPKGRKPRELKISWEELDNQRVAPDFRDYCADFYVTLAKCMRSNAPVFSGRACQDQRREFGHCLYEDALMRAKEYERERRLLQRRQRKIKAGTYTYPENNPPPRKSKEEKSVEAERKIEQTPQQSAVKQEVAEAAQRIVDRPEAQKSEQPFVGGINE